MANRPPPLDIRDDRLLLDRLMEQKRVAEGSAGPRWVVGRPWPKLSRQEKLEVVDAINGELRKMGEELAGAFQQLFTEVEAPLSVHAEIFVSYTDNNDDPRLPDA